MCVCVCISMTFNLINRDVQAAWNLFLYNCSHFLPELPPIPHFPEWEGEKKEKK